ncbi:hypothetical protein [Aeromonas enteropelogenes]|uniref:hypothetical protein n=1 Tax=Aeromonas enteropelogenes TaxID=29489 RepID=UPI003BA2C657
MIISEILEPWLCRATWFSTHPVDADIFDQVVSDLQNRVLSIPHVQELEDAIYARVRLHEPVLGAPQDLRLSAREFAEEIVLRLERARV